ncbi:16S rRNA (uracil(1498)-N(3))-methyltransferase [Paenibacillus sp. y28]|uniref:16S rRNA (uracil(1498)-N(3))-methyltransferase n=1 Tax=Paenibacillus sp. y28 TaxID=3129110 RepID=UPI003015C2E5
MQRYFVDGTQFSADSVRITGDDAHHLIRVMRAEPGDLIICSDGANREVEAELVLLEKQEVTARIVRELPMENEPHIQVWIAQSLPKGDKMETVIQKCTELGAARFIPFVSERTVVQYEAKKEAKRLERWQKIAKEAAEQAHRNRVPDISAPLTWKQLLAEAAQADSGLICYEKPQGQGIRAAVQAAIDSAGCGGQAGADSKQKPDGTNRTAILVVIGPEGGFSEREVAEAESAGCRAISLGRRILRTETAAMAALSCILYEAGEMGG